MTFQPTHQAHVLPVTSRHNLIFASEAYAISGAALEVYNTLGPGFAEAVYQKALGLELLAKAIPHKPQKEIWIRYKGRRLRRTYLADFVAYGQIIIEIKAIQHLGDQRRSPSHQFPQSHWLQIGAADQLWAPPSFWNGNESFTRSRLKNGLTFAPPGDESPC